IQHIPNIVMSKGMRLRAICDLDPVQLAKTKAEYHPDYADSDIDVLIKDPVLDVIFIVVAHQFHAQLIRRVAPSKKAIFVEKPMAMDMKECRLIVNDVRKYGNKLMVGFNRRFAPSMLGVKKAYDKRKGEALITYRIVADRKRYNNGKIDMKTWGGDLLGETCHIFDLMRWLTGKEPSTLYCEGWQDDNSITTMRFGDQVVSIVSGGIGDLRYPKERLEIFRDRSTIVLDCFAELYNGLYHPPLGTKRWLKRSSFPISMHYADKILGRGIEVYAKGLRKYIPRHDAVKKRTGNYEVPIPEVDKGHFNEIEAFAEAIRNNERSPIDEVAGSFATLCAMKAFESLKTGQAVKIKPSEYFAK
ncbi:MAG: Gfo/Idh/MocA family oxidoreductase, partial [Candidatus Firestonebacteria bacterium]